MSKGSYKITFRWIDLTMKLASLKMDDECKDKETSRHGHLKVINHQNKSYTMTWCSSSALLLRSNKVSSKLQSSLKATILEVDGV